MVGVIRVSGVPRLARVLAAMLASMAVVGCSGDGPAAPAGPTVGDTYTAPPLTGTPTGPAFTSRVIATGLANPWEVTWGPDRWLWITEKSGGRVIRIDPASGTRETALTLPDILATAGAQDGLLGLALHPDLLKGSPYVFLAYTYDANPGVGLDRRAKLVRYTYSPGTRQLSAPRVLISGLPASVDHDSGRLVFGPDGKLYYTIGDQGNNQFDRYCEQIRAQVLPTSGQVAARDWSAYQGKVLRLNPDGSIPADNPLLAGVRSHVYTYGHRNAQGLVFGPGGRLYASEQGPKSDDEVNLIAAGRNYGWPRVAGFKDDKAYVYGDWSSAADCASLGYDDYQIPQSVPVLKESTFTDPAFTPPLRTFSTVEPDFNFRQPGCERSYFICWPTVAPSSLDVYSGASIPGWGPSLLMPSLKDGTVYRMTIGADGSLGDPQPLFRSVNRYRDTAISPDGLSFFIATDVAGMARDRSGRPTTALENPGAILEFRYRPA